MPNSTHLRVIAATSFVAGAAVACLLAIGYLLIGHVPVAVSDAPFPFEAAIAHRALDRRLARESVPAKEQGTEADLLAGAVIYRQQCAVCHGSPAEKAEIGMQMFPRAPQLWTSHRTGVVGVSDDPVAETVWKVKNGIRLSGMPSFEKDLSATQIWQVSVLLHEANKPMSQGVLAELNAAQESRVP